MRPTHGAGPLHLRELSRQRGDLLADGGRGGCGLAGLRGGFLRLGLGVAGGLLGLDPGGGLALVCGLRGGDVLLEERNPGSCLLQVVAKAGLGCGRGLSLLGQLLAQGLDLPAQCDDQFACLREGRLGVLRCGAGFDRGGVGLDPLHLRPR